MSSLKANIPVPQAAGLIERPRLIEQLNKVAEYPLTLLCAPPGYGKSTITAQWAHQTALPVAWHMIGARERNALLLHQQCVNALSIIEPRIADDPPQAGISPYELAAHLTDQIRARLSTDFVFVLDDVHHLTGSVSAEVWLRSFVSTAPANCHLMIVSRTLPDLPLTQMIARREVLAMGQDQLRLQPQEIRDLATRVDPQSPTLPNLTYLAERLEGWPAGTVLALHPLPADLERSLLAGEAGPEALFGALADLMLQAQPSGLRSFLLASSVPTRFTPDLCENVLGFPNSHYWMQEAQKQNLFISTVAGGFSYHRLFREFLQDRLQQDDQVVFNTYHVKLAQWYEESDNLEEAFEHFMAAGEASRAAAIARTVTRLFFTQGRTETLLDWRDALQDVGIQEPALLVACAKIFTDRADYARAEASLVAAETAARETQAENDLAEIHLQRAMILLQRGEYDAVVNEVAYLVEGDAPPGIQTARAHRYLGMAALRLGDGDKAVRQLAHSVTLYREHTDAYALSQALQDLAFAQSRQGRLAEASASLQEVVSLRRTINNLNSLALALNNLGYYYHRSGSYEQAWHTLQEGLSVCAKAPNPRTESYLLASMGDLERDRGAFEDALNQYNRALELTRDTDPSLRCTILTNAATLWRWRGDPQEASRLAEEAIALATAHNISLDKTMAQAAFWVATNQHLPDASALDALVNAAYALQEQGADYESIWVHTWCASAAILSGQSEVAAHHLQLAVDIGRALGTVRPLAAEAAHLSAFEKLISAQPERHHDILSGISALRATHNPTAAPAATAHPLNAQVTYSLHVQAFLKETVERNSTLVPLSAWRSTTARELFFFLLFNGGSSRERISLAFWPDSSTKAARSNFHTTLYRARQAAGEDAIVFHNDTYDINRDLDLWCDAFEMETLTQQAKLLSPRDARTEDMFRRATTLYKGEFLPSIFHDWAVEQREHLHELYLEALIGLAHCARERRGHREAITIYRQAIEQDPFREDVHRAIMACFAELGERSQIVKQLDVLRSLLRRELGIQPSPETVTFARDLLK